MSTPTTGTATASSSLMYNYLAATSIDASSPLGSAEDQAGNPLLFTVGDPATAGNGKTLWVMLHDPSVPAGWRRVACTPDPAHNVQAYALTQAPDGTVVLVVGVDDGNGGTRVWVSPRITPLADGSPWTALASQWVAREGAPAGQPVQRFVMGDGPVATAAPLLIAEVKSNVGTISRYFVDASTTSMTSAWSPWIPPTDVQTLYDVVVGNASVSGHAYQGTWTLYEDTSSSSTNPVVKLQFSSLPDEYGRSHTINITPPAGSRCLSALPDSSNGGNSSLFIGGDALSYFPSASLTGKLSTATTIATSVSGIRAILACQDSNHFSVWAVDSNQNLNYTSAAIADAPAGTSGWATPLVLRQHVAQITPRRNSRRQANEIFLTTSDNSTIAYLWQDPDSTSWQNSDVPLPALSSTQEFACYTTVARFVDGSGQPLVNTPIQVGASEWTWALANGYWMALDNTPGSVTLNTDALGTITIINKISDLGTPVFRFSASFLAQELLADPGAAVRSTLAAKLQSTDLSDWKRADGTSVIPAGTDTATVQQIQSSLQMLLNSAPGLPTDGSPAADPTDPAPSGTPSATPQAEPATKGTSFSVVGAIETAAGDVLQALESAGEAIYQYVIQPVAEGVEGLVQFFVKIGSEILTFVVRTLSELMQLISWLFQQLALLIEDLIELLGFLFSWDDILDTHTVLRQSAVKCLDDVELSLKAAGPLIDKYFNDLIAQLPGMADSPLLRTYGDTNLATILSTAPASDTAAPAAQSSDFFNSAPGSFATYQLAHGGITDGKPNDGNDIEQAISDFVKTVVNLLQDVEDSIKTVITGIANLYNTNQLTLTNLVTLIASDVMATILAQIRDVLVGLCNIVADFVQLAEDVMTKVIEIPLLSGLYRMITDGSDPSLLDALALLLAIPCTVAYKLVRGVAPFPGGQMPGFLTSPAVTFALEPMVMAAVPAPTTSAAAKAPAPASNTQALVSPDGGLRPFPNLADDPGYKIYSQVGAVAGMVSAIGVAITAPVQLQASKAKRVATVAGGIEAAMLVLSASTSFPADESITQQRIDRFKWMLDVTTALFACAATRCAAKAVLAHGTVGADAAEAADKSTAEALAIVSILDGGYGVFAGVASYLLELKTIAEGSVPDYHGFWLDTGKLITNLCLDTGTITEAAASISYQDELYAATLLAYFFYAAINSVRAFCIIDQDLTYQAT